MEGATFIMPYTPGSQYQYQEVSGMLATKIVNPPPRINISNQMDQLFSEYLQYCDQEKEVPKFTRDDCPSEYGGKRVDVLLGSKEISPVLEFRASSGLEVFSHPFTTPPGVPKLAVGGSIPTSDSNIINLIVTNSMTDEEMPPLTDISSSEAETSDEDDSDESDYDSDSQSFAHNVQETKPPNTISDSEVKFKGDPVDTARRQADDMKVPDNIQATTAKALLGDIPECSHHNHEDVAHTDNTVKQKYFISLETSPVEKEIVEDIKDKVQKKLLLPNPENRMKQHASHVTLGIMQFSPSEEIETAKL